jgi:hypothetical protein
MIAKREGGQTNVSGSVDIVDEEQEFETKEEHEYSATMKVLYRRITKITHPDKVESEFLHHIFKKRHQPTLIITSQNYLLLLLF